MQIYDILYFGLSGLMVVFLFLTFIRLLIVRRKVATGTQRHWVSGLIFLTIGLTISLIAGVSLNELARRAIISDLIYQQVHFSIFYIGFAMVLYGIMAEMTVARKSAGFLPKDSQWRQVNLSMCGLYLLTVILACLFLFNKDTYTFTPSGNVIHAAQQRVFFVPLFCDLAIGILALAVIILKCHSPVLRRHFIWFGLFILLFMVGMLREATIIPSSGEPMVDLFVAFGPFTLGSICLYLSSTTAMGIRNPESASVEG